MLLSHEGWLRLRGDMTAAAFPVVEQLGRYKMDSWPAGGAGFALAGGGDGEVEQLGRHKMDSWPAGGLGGWVGAWGGSGGGEDGLAWWVWSSWGAARWPGWGAGSGEEEGGVASLFFSGCKLGALVCWRQVIFLPQRPRPTARAIPLTSARACCCCLLLCSAATPHAAIWVYQVTHLLLCSAAPPPCSDVGVPGDSPAGPPPPPPAGQPLRHASPGPRVGPVHHAPPPAPRRW